MDYGLPDSNGRDDHPRGARQRRFPGGGRGFIHRRSVVIGTSQLPRSHSDMETQIHHVEQEAYTSVLRAFKAQSDAITWEKESLITELRKELRVSDEEHRVLLSRVNADNIIQEIREWRKTSGLQPGTLSSSQPAQDHLTPSPTVSTSCKKHKTLQSAGSMSLGGPSPTWRTPIQPSSLALKRSHFSGANSKVQKLKGSTGRPQLPGWGSSGTFAANEPSGVGKFDQLIGRKVWTRWPEDNNFYEAVISDYNRLEGRYALIYDINTSSEALEWVNLKEISRQDIRWEGQNPGIIPETGSSRTGSGFKKSMPHAAAVAGAGRGVLIKGVSKTDFPSSRNGTRRMSFGDIRMLHTDTLIKEVKRIFSANPPDPAEIEKAKKVLKDHEQNLVDAITRLEDASDGESEEEVRRFLKGQLEKSLRGES